MSNNPVTASSGARFFRSALQVNPFPYIQRHSKECSYGNEAEYNTAMVDALTDAGVEVICVTDHYRVRSGESLVAAASSRGIHAFLGFEAVTKDGVHFLCVFDKTMDVERLDRYLGACGIHDESGDSPIGKLDCSALLDRVPTWGGICIAAHVSSDGGLLKTLKGLPRANVWKDDKLLACSLPGPAKEAPEEHRRILSNTDVNHRRRWPMAVVNAQDLSDPAEAEKPSKSCLIKMTTPSVEALRQAFLDPESRVRLLSDPTPPQHYQILDLAWEGGFLDGLRLPLNENLNCLIGGRGTGKSSIIESIRALFGIPPLGQEAQRRHKAILDKVIRPGSKITATVAVHRPQEVQYSVELVLPEDSFVRNRDGSRSKIKPSDLIPGIEIYGQHEISELADDPKGLTDLLGRFLEEDKFDRNMLIQSKQKLSASREEILTASRKISTLETRLAVLPRLEEELKRYEAAGIAGHLAEQTAVINEQAELGELAKPFDGFKVIAEDLQDMLPVTLDGVSLEALRASPLGTELARIDSALTTFNNQASEAGASLSNSLRVALSVIADLRTIHSNRKKGVDKKTGQLLRQLGGKSIDGQEYIRTKTLISELAPLRSVLEKTKQALVDARTSREDLLRSFDDQKARQFRDLERAAKRVSRALAGSVRVSVSYQGDRVPLWEQIRKIKGRLAETVKAIDKHPIVTPTTLVRTMREGPVALQETYGITAAPAERLAGASPQLMMEIEELDLGHTTQIALNVAAQETEPVWRDLSELSAGQRATAVLLLLLLESPAPLIVDQPEDDLDNRFIYDGVVPRMRNEKHRRQFIFATHNANIPVLGDAELIACFNAGGDGSEEHAQLHPECIGSIDVPTVRELVEQVLEGGSEAFELRRKKYRY